MKRRKNFALESGRPLRARQISLIVNTGARRNTLTKTLSLARSNVSWAGGDALKSSVLIDCRTMAAYLLHQTASVVFRSASR